MTSIVALQDEIKHLATADRTPTTAKRFYLGDFRSDSQLLDDSKLV